MEELLNLKKKVILSLFSGTNSWTKPYENDNRFKIITLDNNVDFKTNADIQMDILQWDYTTLQDKIDIIYASPPCNLYFTNIKHLTGCVKYTEADKLLSLKLVDKTIEIINFFKPKYFIIENPRAKMRQHYPEILGEKPQVFYYCQNGFDYKKPTDIWSNIKLEQDKCNHKKHIAYIKGTHNKMLNDRIAPLLAERFANYIKNHIFEVEV